MIEFAHVSFAYDDAGPPVLRDVNLTIGAGELCLVIGPTGSGKSSLLGLINGHVPHFTGGHVSGRVAVDGRDTRTHRPRDLADTVGVVGQDPLAGFVTDSVEEELAYAMEQLAVAPSVMRKRVEETLDLLGIAELRARPMRTLSGGQQQRIAIGAALTAHPQILVLDEPTSALDPTAAEDVIAAITRLVHDLGVTVVMAEHRIERVVHYADRIISINADGTVVDGTPADVLATSRIAPPIVRLGRLAGWNPLPLSVRDARRLAPSLVTKLSGAVPPSPGRTGLPRTVLAGDGVTVAYGDVIAVRDVDVELNAGEVVALMGRNGSGKSSLLWAVQGSGPRAGGRVAVDGRDPHDLDAAEARALVGLVPQTPSDLLYLESVAAECAQADRDANAVEGTCRKLLDRIVANVPDDHHPRDLSEGQRLGLVLAVQLTASPRVVLLDEPTRGLDYTAKDQLRDVLLELANEGHAIAIATHDVEFVAAVADRVIVMAEGEVVAAGPTKDVVSASPAFAPQVAKILGDSPWLTVDDVAAALETDQ